MCMGGWEGTQQGQVTRADQKDSPDHVASCSVREGGKEEKSGGMYGVMAFVFPSHCYALWSPPLPEMAEHLPAHRKERINSLFCFASVHGFCFPSLIVFISAYEFCSSNNSDPLSLIPLVGE